MKVISLAWCKYISDFSTLAELKKLEYVNVSVTQFDDFSAIGQLEHLQSIWAHGMGLQNWDDMSLMPNAKNIESLYINGGKYSNIDFLSVFTNLKDLQIGETDLEDISVLEDLVFLRSVGLSSVTISKNSDVVNRLTSSGCSIIKWH